MSPFPDLPPEDWPALYAAGSSLAQIADRTGYSATRVRKELLARGVVLRRPGVRLGSRRRLSDWHATAAMMRAHGYCYAAIARELGQSPAAVRSALVRQAEDGRRPSPRLPGPHEPAP
jgi:lambda repressor-like predicted transcriptional regulator